MQFPNYSISGIEKTSKGPLGQPNSLAELLLEDRLMPQALITERWGWQNSSFAAEVCGGSQGNSVFIKDSLSTQIMQALTWCHNHILCDWGYLKELPPVILLLRKGG